MISFRTRNDAIASTIIIFAVVLLLATAVWYSLFPAPTVAGTVAKAQRNQKLLNETISQAEESTQKSQSIVEPLISKGTPETVGPVALAAVTKVAKAHGLKLVAFRPQKPIEGAGLTQIPFSITVDGPFPTAMQFVRDLSNPDLKLAVSTVQVASADQASDRVTGTIVVVAYVKPAQPTDNKGIQNAKQS